MKDSGTPRNRLPAARYRPRRTWPEPWRTLPPKGLTVNPAGQNLLSYFPTTASGTFVASTPTTARMDEFAFKIDHRINKNNTINGRYIFGDDLQSGPPFAGLPAGGGHPADTFNSIAPTRAQMAGISWTWTISNNKILESRLGYTRFAQIIDINNKIDPKTLGVDTGPLSPVDFGVPYVYLAPLGYGGYIGGCAGLSDYHAAGFDLGLVGAFFVGERRSHHQAGRELSDRLHQQLAQSRAYWTVGWVTRSRRMGMRQCP